MGNYPLCWAYLTGFREILEGIWLDLMVKTDYSILMHIVVIPQITCKILEVFLWFGHVRAWLGKKMDVPQELTKTLEPCLEKLRS